LVVNGAGLTLNRAILLKEAKFESKILLYINQLQMCAIKTAVIFALNEEANPYLCAPFINYFSRVGGEVKKSTNE